MSIFINIERFEDDTKLAKGVWTFYLYNDVQLVLNEYRKQTRPTRRHSLWTDVVHYKRLLDGTRSDYAVTRDESVVSWPAEVVEEARRLLVEQISVGRWSTDFGLR